MTLRDIVMRNQEELALREYLGDKYDTTSLEDKKKFTDYVKPTTEKEVDLILRTFVEDAQKGSSAQKRRKNVALLNFGLSLILTPAIGYAVNIQNWIMVIVCSSVMLLFHLYLLRNET